MNLIDAIKTIEKLSELGTGDKILAGLLVALIGMGITALALLILWFMIRLISIVSNKIEAFSSLEKKEVQKSTLAQEKDDKEELQNSKGAEPISAEVIAVITCAIHESLNHRHFKIHHISRKTEESAVWRMSEDGEVWK